MLKVLFVRCLNPSDARCNASFPVIEKNVGSYFRLLATVSERVQRFLIGRSTLELDNLDMNSLTRCGRRDFVVELKAAQQLAINRPSDSG